MRPDRPQGVTPHYPALLGAAGLGERILNQIILELRAAYADNPLTNQVSTKNAFDDWKLMLRVLRSWDVMSDDVAAKFKRLARLRHNAVHYNVPSLDTDARTEALEALELLQFAIEQLFHPLDHHLIPNVAGAHFLRLDVEEQPFVRSFFIPASVLVSPRHEWITNDPVTVLDDQRYGLDEGVSSLSDEEFAARFASA